LRAGAEHQYGERNFHPISFAGGITIRTGRKRWPPPTEAIGQSAPPCENALLRALERVSSADRFTSTLALLFLLAGRETRLPFRGLLAWRRSYCLDLLFLGLLDFPISSLLALGHIDLLWVDDDAVIERRISHCRVARRSSHRVIDLFGQFDFADLMQTGSHDRCLGRSHGERLSRFIAEFDAPESPVVAMRLDQQHWKIGQPILKQEFRQRKHHLAPSSFADARKDMAPGLHSSPAVGSRA